MPTQVKYPNKNDMDCHQACPGLHVQARTKNTKYALRGRGPHDESQAGMFHRLCCPFLQFRRVFPHRCATTTSHAEGPSARLDCIRMALLVIGCARESHASFGLGSVLTIASVLSPREDPNDGLARAGNTQAGQLTNSVRGRRRLRDEVMSSCMAHI